MSSREEDSAVRWIRCAGSFIAADLIRWRESVWEEPVRKRGRRAFVGDRVVIAEVIREDGEWVDLLVRDCAIVSENTSRTVPGLAKDLEVRRRRKTIEKGKPERCLWSDEVARAFLIRDSTAAEDPGAPPTA